MSEPAGRVGSVRRRLWGIFVATAMAAAGCGGSGGDSDGVPPPPPPPPPLAVKLTVGEAAGPVMTLKPGTTATIQVLRGRHLAFDSEAAFKWSIVEGPWARAEVRTEEPNSKSADVSGPADSYVAFRVENAADSTELATVTVRLVEDGFNRIAPREAELQQWQSTVIQTPPTYPSSDYAWFALTSQVYDDGSYVVDTDLWSNDYDSSDGLVNASNSFYEKYCHHAPSYASVVYPVQTGSTWSYQGTQECTEMIFDKLVTRRSRSNVVEGFESVTTPAGTFMAARIRSNESYLYTDADWPDQNDSGTVTSVCWWATEIARMVRCHSTKVSALYGTDEWIEELTTFLQ